MAKRKSKPKPRADEATGKPFPEAADEALAHKALEKLRAGDVLTARETEALRRVEKRRGDNLRLYHYRTIAKKHWCDMSGRSNKILNQQADRHGAPLRGKEISLPEFLKWFHDFLAENAHLLADKIDGVVVDGVALHSREQLVHETTRQRKGQADKVEAEVLRMRGDLIPVEDFRIYWQVICSKMRRAEAALQRRFGRQAALILKKARNDAEKEARKIGRNGNA